MKPIDTKTHGYIDYIMGIVLIAVPFLLHLDSESTPSIVLFVLGAGALVYSLLTNYELGLVKLIPMNIHLMLDIASGIFLAASPWLLGFSEIIYIPHLILGLLEIGAAVMTSSKVRIEI